MGGTSSFPNHPSFSLCLQETRESQPALPGAKARDGPRPLRGGDFVSHCRSRLSSRRASCSCPPWMEVSTH